MTLEELRVEQEEIKLAAARCLKDDLASMVGQQLQKVECWPDEGLIILTFDDACLSVESDSELIVEVVK